MSEKILTTTNILHCVAERTAKETATKERDELYGRNSPVPPKKRRVLNISSKEKKQKRTTFSPISLPHPLFILSNRSFFCALHINTHELLLFYNKYSFCIIYLIINSQNVYLYTGKPSQINQRISCEIEERRKEI